MIKFTGVTAESMVPFGWSEGPWPKLKYALVRLDDGTWSIGTKIQNDQVGPISVMYFSGFCFHKTR